MEQRNMGFPTMLSLSLECKENDSERRPKPQPS